MSIQKKLYAGFITIICLFIVICSIAFTQMTRVSDDYKQVIEQQVEQVIYLKEIDNAIASRELNIRSYFINKEARQLENMTTQNDLIQAHLDELEKMVNNEEATTYITSIRDAQTQFLNMSQNMQTAIAKHQEKQALHIMNDEIQPMSEEMNTTIQTFIDMQEAEKEQAFSASKAGVTQAKLWIIVSIIIVTVIAAIIVIRITRSIILPLHTIHTVARDIAKGDLSKNDIEVHTKDELHAIAVTFNMMKNNLLQLVLNVSNTISHTTTATEDLATSTQILATASDKIAGETTTLKEAGQNASSLGSQSDQAMEEVANGIQVIASSTVDLHENAIGTQQLAEKGDTLLKTTESQMQTIQAASDDTNARIHKLAVQSKEINDISTVITNIADQTNLLALNAAIEAARAGDHGKGFAVVADEVRKLAEESKISASRIENITRIIQVDTSQVESSITDTVEKVTLGMNSIQEAQQTFDEIVDAVAKMTHHISDASASTEQISASIQEVSASINEMAHSSETSAKQAESISSLTDQQSVSVNAANDRTKVLSEETFKLQQQIQQFKI